MKLIGHRGSSHEAPENTLNAIQLAWQEMADGVEVDVRASRDQRCMLMHDETLARTTGLAGRLEDQTWDILRVADAGTWKGPRWRHCTIPLLRDVLRVVPNGRLLYLELKGDRDMLPALISDFAVGRPDPARIRFLSFDARLLREIRQKLPAYAPYWNVEAKGHAGAPRNWSAEALCELAIRDGFRGLSVGYCSAITASFISTVKEHNLGLVVWTVDDEVDAQRLMDEGLPELMTNRPGYLRQKLRGGAR